MFSPAKTLHRLSVVYSDTPPPLSIKTIGLSPIIFQRSSVGLYENVSSETNRIYKKRFLAISASAAVG